jgi:pyrophosphatase PpaX
MNELRYRGVLFDLDGTLLDSGADLVRTVRYALQQVVSAEPPDEEDILMLVGLPLETILSRLGYPADEVQTNRFVTAYREHFLRHGTDSTRPFPHVVPVLERLKELGVRLGVVTTKHQSQAEVVLDRCGLDGVFDYVHGHLDGRRHKPHPEPVIVASGKLGLAVRDVLMVGDTELDIESGRAAGAATCGVTYGFRPVALLHQMRPDYLLRDVRDLVAIVAGAER